MLAAGCSDNAVGNAIPKAFEQRTSLPTCGDVDHTTLGRPATRPEHTAATDCLLSAAANSGKAELYQTLQGVEGRIDQWLRVDGTDREMFMLAPRSDGKRLWSRWRCTGIESLNTFEADTARAGVLGCAGMVKV